MNFRLVCKQLGLVALLIGVVMIFSLPWAFPSLGWRYDVPQFKSTGFEADGFFALVGSILVSGVVGVLLIIVGRRSPGVLYHKEAMAVVGLAWLMATVLGGLPFYLSGTYSSPSIRLGDSPAHVYLFAPDWLRSEHWRPKYKLSNDQQRAIARILDAGPRGISAEDAQDGTGKLLHELADDDADFRRVLLFPGDPGFEDRVDRYRLLWTKMSFIDALFESQSGFSTTGATVISELEDPRLVPHCILFWRSSTHFLGGLGIIVLFVVILGQGSAGKALMRYEVPGPSQEGSQARVQQTAWVFAGIYFGLNALLTLLLKWCGMSWFDALCHAFGTMATGGFSTYNASVGHFDNALIDGIILLFMLLAGTNFTLLYLLLLGKPGRMFEDIEWRAYVGIIAVASLGVVCLGYVLAVFTTLDGQPSWTASVRYGLFQVVSIMTTTGYVTHDFDDWHHLGRSLLMVLMFIGGCAGSTGGGLKVIRVVLLAKILGLELERAYHPRVVRPLRIGGKVVEDSDLRKNIPVYFAVVLSLFVLSWLLVVGLEPDTTWAGQDQHKLIDSASAVAATLNNIGPGLGTVGATKNYAHFGGATKLLFTWLMMLGRVEVFAILVLFVPNFWRSR